MTSCRPRQIPGDVGSRVRVLLGSTGSDYLLVLEHDDGNRTWYTTSWRNIPHGLCRQLNNIENKGRHVTSVAFGPNEEWFVTGEKADGTGGHAWWGGVDSHNYYFGKEIKKGNHCEVAFGPDDGYFLLAGNNGYTFHGNINNNLKQRVKRMNAQGKTIHFVRLFPHAGDYFVSDSQGTEWALSNNAHLSKTLKSGGSVIRDVAVAGDRSWIVIEGNRFVPSTGICKALRQELEVFFTRQRQWIDRRNREISEYDELVRKQKEEEERKKRIEEERKCKEEALKKRRLEGERNLEIAAKRLRVGDKVTIVGDQPVTLPAEGGIISQITRDGLVQLSDGKYGSTELTITDPRTLLNTNDYHQTDTDSDLALVYVTGDKYEAAVSLFHCQCSGGVCSCKRVFSGRVQPNVFLPYVANVPTASTSVLYRPVFEMQTSQESTPRPPLDPYKCVEKIDFVRLERLVNDLDEDSQERQTCL